jgi:O-antigen/teichoic acid export membrane protein
MNLKDFAIKGITWTALSQIVRQGIQIFTTIILARILQPSDFGLMGMALVIIGFVNVFKDLGTSSAIIQKKEISQELLSSVFWFNIIFGSITSVIILLLAPLFAAAFNEVRLEPIVRIFVISFFATTVFSIQQALLEKKMNFRRLAWIEIFASVIGAITGLGIALNGGGVWSLVVQAVSMSLVLCALLWIQNLRWIPSLHFRMIDIKAIRSFSSNLTGFTLLNYFLRNADSFIIGRFLGASDLGLYNLALKVIILPVQNFTTVISRVMYPLYSTIAEDHAAFRHTYLKTATTIGFFTIPFFIFLMIASEEFVMLFFGEKWTAVIPLLLILTPVGLLQSLDITTGTIYLATGRTDIMLRWGLFTGVVSVCAFYFGAQWGIQGVATGYLIATLLWTFHGFKIPLMFIKQNVVEFFKSFAGIGFSVCIAAGCVIIVNAIFINIATTSQIFIADIIVFSFSYLGMSYIINKAQFNLVISVFRNISFQK